MISTIAKSFSGFEGNFKNRVKNYDQLNLATTSILVRNDILAIAKVLNYDLKVLFLNIHK